VEGRKEEDYFVVSGVLVRYVDFSRLCKFFYILTKNLIAVKKNREDFAITLIAVLPFIFWVLSL
jgi:hypothetical protein